MNPSHSPLSADDVVRLRATHYNSSVVEVRSIHASLCILRVQPDSGPPAFEPGQYTTLGLGDWEPYVGAAPLPPGTTLGSIIKRAYSFSARMLDEGGRLIDSCKEALREFYLALVPATVEHPAGLTPRLFALQPGDRLFMGLHAKGHYTLAGVHPDDDVIFAATGTGEAPHNAMIARLLLNGHRGRIVSIVGVRYRRDLAYLDAHRRLEQMFPSYRYIPLTTREPENIDSARADFIGKQYVQGFFQRGEIERVLGKSLAPDGTHVFLCGNPAMVGAPRLQQGSSTRVAVAGGMCELLEQRGFRDARPGVAGNVHCEEYEMP